MARYSKRRPRRRRRPSRRSNRSYLIIGLLIMIAAGWAAMSMGDKNSSGTDANQVDVGGERSQQIEGFTQNSRVKNTSIKPESTGPSMEKNVQPIIPLQEEKSNEDVSRLLAQASATLNDDPKRLVEVRLQLNDALLKPMSRAQRLIVQDKLKTLADEWLFSRTICEGDDLCEFYQVKPGDRLETIGRQYQVPYEIIMRINNIPSPEALRADKRIKVPKGPFHVKVYKDNFTMDLFLQKTYVKSYPVGLGKPGHETPSGRWVVRSGDKLIRPQWTDSETGRVYYGNEPDYPLGERWIGIRGVNGDTVGRRGFALHGTNEPQTIGTACSNGCVRLRNEDIVELFGLLYEEASQVFVD